MNIGERSRRRMGMWMAFACGCALGVAPVWASEPASTSSPAPATAAAAAALPDAAELIAKYFQVSGGEAWRQHAGRVSTGTFEMPAMGLKASIITEQAQPNKLRLTIDIPQIGKMEQGSDGTSVWSNDAMQGPRLADGPEKAQIMRSAMMVPEDSFKQFYSAAKTVADEPVEGVAAWKIELTPKEGNPEHWWLAKDTGLLVKTSVTIASPMGEVASESFMSDYRDVDGVKIPFVLTQRAMGMEQVFKTEKVEHKDIPAERFAIPAEVQALIDAAKKGAPADATTPPAGTP